MFGIFGRILVTKRISSCIAYSGDDWSEVEGFEFLAPTTRRNALRALRAMQLAKPGT